MIRLFGKKSFKELPDAALVSELLAGNQEAIVYFFYNKFTATFQYHIYNLFPYRVDVEELIDEFFMFLYEDDWRRLRTFDASKAALSTWVSTVSFRFFRDYKQSMIDCNGLITIDDKWETFQGDWSQSMSDGLMMDLEAAIAEIRNERDRGIARRIFVEDAAFEAVAEEFNLDVDYVYTVKNRLLRQLREKLKAYR